LLTAINRQGGNAAAWNQHTTRTATAVQDWARKGTNWPTHTYFFLPSPIKTQLKDHMQTLSLKGAHKAFEQACLQVCARRFVRKRRGRIKRCVCLLYTQHHALFPVSSSLC